MVLFTLMALTTKVDTENARVGGEDTGEATQAGYQATQGAL